MPLGDGLYYEEPNPSDVCILQADTRPFQYFMRPDYKLKNFDDQLEKYGYIETTAFHNMQYALRYVRRTFVIEVEAVPTDLLDNATGMATASFDGISKRLKTDGIHGESLSQSARP